MPDTSSPSPPLWRLARAVFRLRGAAPRPAPPPAAEIPVPPPADPPPVLPYEAMVETLPDAILVVQARSRDAVSGRYVFANRAARELLKLEAPEGRLLNAVRDPGVLAALEEALFGSGLGDCVYETGGNAPKTLRVRARALAVSAHGARLALLALHDETELRQVERTRVDFLANASHELRTPLASLSGFIETLRGHARDDVEARDRFLGIMQAQAERMSRLINDLLALSRIELNEHVPPSEEADLAMVAGEVIEAVAPLGRERGVTIEAELPAWGEARIRGDRDQVVQVIQNLLENALKYSPDGGVVRLQADAQVAPAQLVAQTWPEAVRFSLVLPDAAIGPYAALTVRDAGPGIARENLPRLTERFFRVEGQKSGERSGTGLGLAIVKHIVNRHQGGLVVESLEGQGSAFTAYFPAMTAEPAVVAKAS